MESMEELDQRVESDLFRRELWAEKREDRERRLSLSSIEIARYLVLTALDSNHLVDKTFIGQLRA